MHEGALIAEQRRRLDQRHAAGRGAGVVGRQPRRHAAFGQHAQEVASDEADALAAPRRHQPDDQAVARQLVGRQLAVEAVDAGLEGGRRLRARFQLRQGAPQRHLEAAFDAAAVVDALVQQVAQIEREQAHRRAGRQRGQQDGQALGKHPRRAEGGLFYHRDIADAAVVQFAVYARLFQAVAVEQVVLFRHRQIALQPRQLRLHAEDARAFVLQRGDGLVVSRHLGLELAGAHAAFQLAAFQQVDEVIGRAVFRALHGVLLPRDQGLDRGDALIQFADGRRVRQIGLELVQPLQLQAVELELEILLCRIQAQLALLVISRGSLPPLAWALAMPPCTAIHSA